MKRFTIAQEKIDPNWIERQRNLGFDFSCVSPDGDDLSEVTQAGQYAYWLENVGYEIDLSEADAIEDAADAVHNMAVDVLDDMVRAGNLEMIGFKDKDVLAEIELSFKMSRHNSLYGRFDMLLDGNGVPKVLEYNADTPTSLIEASIAQHFWREIYFPSEDQHNLIHESLVERWPEIVKDQWQKPMLFACAMDCAEDASNTRYLMETFLEAQNRPDIAGLTQMCDIEHLDFTGEFAFRGSPVSKEVAALFKLYPWEFLLHDIALSPVGSVKGLANSRTQMVEPLWKAALSNKALMAVLWEKHKGHPNLIPTFFGPESLTSQKIVKKPIFSREGGSITVLESGVPILQTEGSYGAEGFVYQEFVEPMRFDCRESAHSVASVVGIHTETNVCIGAWMVGDKMRGIGLREDPSLITRNTAFFVPHYLTW